MIIKVVLVKKGEVIYKNVNITEENYHIVKLKLRAEYKKIVNILKRMKEDGLIKSIYCPVNKEIQNELDVFVSAKRLIKNSIRKIIDIYN